MAGLFSLLLHRQHHACAVTVLWYSFHPFHSFLPVLLLFLLTLLVYPLRSFLAVSFKTH